MPALGGEERLILENATAPQPLPDGSLLAVRINAKRQAQIYRYWPRDGRLDALPAIVETQSSDLTPLRLFPDGTRAVFFGRPAADTPGNSQNYLYILDIAIGNLSRIAADLHIDNSETTREGMAVMPDGESVAVLVANGDMQAVIQVPVHLPAPPRTLLSARGAGHLDVGSDGSLYLDQLTRPVEIARFAGSGAGFERLNAFPNATLQYSAALHLPDGRTVLPAIVGGRNRLLIAAPAKDSNPFIDTDEETGPPLALLGGDRAAFVIGSGSEKRIAIASIQDGRILRRLLNVNASAIRAMASSPDGKILYYVDSAKVWSVSAADGPPREIHTGDGVAVATDGKSLIIQLIEAENVKWIRVNLESGVETPIPVKDNVRFAPTPPGPGAVGPDGRILLSIAVTDDWWWKAAILDPATGVVQRIPVAYDGDFPYAAWTNDGKIVVAAGYPWHSSIWRFQPAKSGRN